MGHRWWEGRGGADHVGLRGPKSSKKPGLGNKSRSLGRQEMLSIPSGHQDREAKHKLNLQQPPGPLWSLVVHPAPPEGANSSPALRATRGRCEAQPRERLGTRLLFKGNHRHSCPKSLEEDLGDCWS